ncbi:unnamed protein product [Closterium sp. NIES-64]|nr:unnamed protein product [Closterium sp. NIES-64]
MKPYKNIYHMLLSNTHEHLEHAGNIIDWILSSLSPSFSFFATIYCNTHLVQEKQPISLVYEDERWEKTIRYFLTHHGQHITSLDLIFTEMDQLPSLRPLNHSLQPLSFLLQTEVAGLRNHLHEFTLYLHWHPLPWTRLWLPRYDLSFPNARLLRFRFASNEFKLTLSVSPALKTLSVMAKWLVLSCKSTAPLASRPPLAVRPGAARHFLPPPSHPCELPTSMAQPVMRNPAAPGSLTSCPPPGSTFPRGIFRLFLDRVAALYSLKTWRTTPPLVLYCVVDRSFYWQRKGAGQPSLVTMWSTCCQLLSGTKSSTASCGHPSKWTNPKASQDLKAYASFTKPNFLDPHEVQERQPISLVYKEKSWQKTIRYFLTRHGQSITSLHLIFTNLQQLPTLRPLIARCSPSLSSFSIKLWGFVDSDEEQEDEAWTLDFLTGCSRLHQLKLGWGMWNLDESCANAAWVRSIRCLTLKHMDRRYRNYKFLESITPQLHEFTLYEHWHLSHGPVFGSHVMEFNFSNARLLRFRFASNELKLKLTVPPSLKSLSVMAKWLVLSCKSTAPLALDHLSLYGQERLVISSLHTASTRAVYLNGPASDEESSCPRLSAQLPPSWQHVPYGISNFSWTNWLGSIAQNVEVLIVRHGIPIEEVDEVWRNLRSLGIVAHAKGEHSKEWEATLENDRAFMDDGEYDDDDMDNYDDDEDSIKLPSIRAPNLQFLFFPSSKACDASTLAALRKDYPALALYCVVDRSFYWHRKGERVSNAPLKHVRQAKSGMLRHRFLEKKPKNVREKMYSVNRKLVEGYRVEEDEAHMLKYKGSVVNGPVVNGPLDHILVSIGAPGNPSQAQEISRLFEAPKTSSPPLPLSLACVAVWLGGECIVAHSSVRSALRWLAALLGGECIAAHSSVWRALSRLARRLCGQANHLPAALAAPRTSGVLSEAPPLSPLPSRFPLCLQTLTARASMRRLKCHSVIATTDAGGEAAHRANHIGTSSVPQMLVGRALTGLAFGVISCVVPVYISEVRASRPRLAARPLARPVCRSAYACALTGLAFGVISCVVPVYISEGWPLASSPVLCPSTSPRAGLWRHLLCCARLHLRGLAFGVISCVVPVYISEVRASRPAWPPRPLARPVCRSAYACALTGLAFGVISCVVPVYISEGWPLASSPVLCPSASPRCVCGAPSSLPAHLSVPLSAHGAFGVISCVVPVYILEIAPASVRGRLGSLNQLAICVGILAALLAGLPLAANPSWWRQMFWIGVAPAAALAAGMLWAPESPRWLAKMAREGGSSGHGMVWDGFTAWRGVVGRIDEAERQLKRLLGPSQAAAAAAELSSSSPQPVASAKGAAGAAVDGLAEAEAGVARKRVDEAPAASFFTLFSNRYRKVVLLAMALFAVQQFAGINAIIYYSSRSPSHPISYSPVPPSTPVQPRLPRSLYRPIPNPNPLPVVLLGMALFAVQQFAGINAIIYYSSSVFRSAGVQSDVAASALVGLANVLALCSLPHMAALSPVVCTHVVAILSLHPFFPLSRCILSSIRATHQAGTAVSLNLVDRQGRKSLLMGSFTGMVGRCGGWWDMIGPRPLISTSPSLLSFPPLQPIAAHLYVITTIAYDCSMLVLALTLSVPPLQPIAAPLSLLGTIAYVLSFAMGAGPVPASPTFSPLPWEPDPCRPYSSPRSSPPTSAASAVAAALTTHWLCNFVIGLSFLGFVKVVGVAAAYVGFAAVCFVGVVFVRACVVETKGRSLEEIERELLGSDA